MKKYEFMMIVNPSLTDEERDTIISEVKDVFTQSNVKVVSEEIWGLKRLAYKINGKLEGFYCLYNLELEDGKLLKSMSNTLNLKKNVYRYIFVKKED